MRVHGFEVLQPRYERVSEMFNLHGKWPHVKIRTKLVITRGDII